jgi:GTPase Era involved in 16S rRNA processing
MERLNELRKKTTDLMRQTVAFSETLRLPMKAERLKEFIDRLERGRTFVVVCGEFKRGKSTFINALLEEIDLCPVDIDITTNMVSQIQYGDEENIVVYFEKETGKPPKVIKRGDLSLYVTELKNKENIEKAQLVDISLPNKLLKKYSLVLVDTPGVGGLEARHSEVTAAYLSFADVILFVCDATAPLTTDELDFIKRTYKFCKNIFFLLTKIDLDQNWRAIDEENREKLSKLLSKKEEEIKTFPISSRNKLDYIKTSDEESLKDSNFVQLEESLHKELNSSIAQNLLLNPLNVLKEEIVGLKEPLNIGYNSCQKDNKQKMWEMQEQLVKYQEVYKSLQKSGADWQRIYNEERINIQKSARQILEDGFNDLEEDISKKVEHDKKFRNEDKINAYINSEVMSIMKDVSNEVDTSTSMLQEQILEEIGKKISIEMDLTITP